MRDLATIEAELKAASYEADKVKGIVSSLYAERLEWLRCRELNVISDFDAGMARKALMHKYGLQSGTLGNIMHKHGRAYRGHAIPISHLPAEQQRAYAKARRWGHGPAAARSMATAMPA